MSASKSWDVQPNRPQPKAAPRAVQKVATRNVAKPAPRREPVSKEPLKVRRQKQRRTFNVVLGIVVLILIAATMYGIWRPEVRIHSINIQGPDAVAAKQVAEKPLWGTYWYVFPRNSIFFYPESDIRTELQTAFPDVAAVSISRSSFSSLHISMVPRISAFIWCGERIDEPTENGVCFDTDAEGLVFKMTEQGAVASSTLKIFAPLQGDITETPLRSRVIGAEHIPNALRLVKAVRSLGVSIVEVSVRADEGDLWTPNGTRITYVLGHEESAAVLASSAFPALNFDTGDLQYVDLRFEKKVYVKKRGE
ncbi:hypothetical protein KKH15_02520 [Patescibacteria group bacterium]|nr:hypothetical protein [Patescibacteria group bacterium]MBU1754912.1 hypothetical protein [Patescibacteria group bacterium]